MRLGRADGSAVFCGLLVTTLLMLAESNDAYAQRVEDSPKYLGHAVTTISPKYDDDGFPSGPASVCVEFVPRSQCYTAPAAFGNNPTARIVQLTADQTAILFSAESGGVSGWQVHFALLRRGGEKELDNLFLSGISVSNQGQHALWDERTLSRSKIFVTADYIWGPDEGHFGAHRFIISAYRRKEPLFAHDDGDSYYLQDRYMTARKYDLDANPNIDVLASEKQEIIARLTRVKTEELRQKVGK